MKAGRDFPLASGWRFVFKDLGISDVDVLRRARLPDDLLTQPDVWLTTDEYLRWWHALEVEAQDPMMPIRLVEAVTAESFTPPLFAALCSPNLLVALQRLSQYKRLIAPVVLHVESGSREVVARFTWLDDQLNPPASLTAMEAAFILRIARMATREHVVPIEVACPVPEDLAPFQSYLGAAITQADALVLRFTSEVCALPFLTANESMWNVFEPELRRRLSQLNSSATVAERVQAVLLEGLPGGGGSIGDTADRLAMSRRTLQRRLKEEGTNFQTVLNHTRERLARHYLVNTSFSCAEISFLLGFEEPNSFYRVFHDWTGDTPERFRAHATAAVQQCDAPSRSEA
ncbi:MAG: AraC family transcriptional regulator ligand-binding domain-containing protein [Myxococcota bacterium]